MKYVERILLLKVKISSTTNALLFRWLHGKKQRQHYWGFRVLQGRAQDNPPEGYHGGGGGPPNTDHDDRSDKKKRKRHKSGGISQFLIRDFTIINSQIDVISYTF